MPEHFIPLRKADLIQHIADECGIESMDRHQFLQLCELIVCRFHYDFHQHLESLKNAYAPFDPDADTIAVDCDPAPRSRTNELFDEVTRLLDKANYRRLSQADISSALDESSEWAVNIDVDFNAFERLEVYVRGDRSIEKTRRSWRTRFKRRTVKMPIYQRLVVVFRLNPSFESDSGEDSDSVFLKMFKDIPRADIETLLPATRVKMSLLDKGRIFLPSVSGALMTLYKAINGALTLAFAGIYGALAFLGLIGGTVGYGIKSFFGYVRTRDKYRLHLTKNLYYQNLDNNIGVLCRLLDEAEEQECREAILAYFLLWRFAGGSGWDQQQLDREAETFLRDEFTIDADFEVGDALTKLVRLRLVQQTDDGQFNATPIVEALQRLDDDWDDFFQFSDQRPKAA
jgi:hypothetical protein